MVSVLRGLALIIGAALGRRRRGERGQVLPLAAGGLLILCLGVLATLNLGQAVHEKIKLQNTADSAAYTLAAMEARTFNYIAFLNRAQIAHYNTAMMVQSYVTWVGFQIATYGTGVEVLTSLRNAFQFGLSWECPGRGCIFDAASSVYVVLEQWNRITERFRQLAVVLYKAGHMLSHDIVEAMAIFNAKVIWQMQFFRAALLNSHILTGMQSYITKLDPDLDFNSSDSALVNWLVNASLNSIEYYQTFDSSSGLNPFAFAAVLGFPRLMKNDFILPHPKGGLSAGEISQAIQDFQNGDFGRYGERIGGLTSSMEELSQSLSKMPQMAGQALSDSASGLVDDFSGGGSLFGEPDTKTAYAIMAELCNGSRSPEFVSNRGGVMEDYYTTGFVHIIGLRFGQTKFVSSATVQKDVTGAFIPEIWAERNYPTGTHLASDDFMTGGVGVGFAGPAFDTWTQKPALGDAIAAYKDGGPHLKYEGMDNLFRAALKLVYPSAADKMTSFPPLPSAVAGAAAGAVSGGSLKPENHAKWPGFAAYFKFNPRASRVADYNQPSTWIFLNKHHELFQSKWESFGAGKAPWYHKFSWTEAGRTAELDTTIAGERSSYLFEGLNAMSRGMAYYHRPGVWQEHPNFFNPFWRARLAPITQKLQSFWDSWVSSSITSDTPALRTAVNVLRNSQMDLFTSAVTSLATH